MDDFAQNNVIADEYKSSIGMVIAFGVVVSSLIVLFAKTYV